VVSVADDLRSLSRRLQATAPGVDTQPLVDAVDALVAAVEELWQGMVVKNLRCCVVCGGVTVLAREFDNAIIVIDPEPHEDGGLVRLHDTALDDQPTMIWGEPVDSRPRYRLHPRDCG
jgi:hypothetical protein